MTPASGVKQTTARPVGLSGRSNIFSGGTRPIRLRQPPALVDEDLVALAGAAELDDAAIGEAAAFGAGAGLAQALVPGREARIGILRRRGGR
jgi:hypothetical protein